MEEIPESIDRKSDFVIIHDRPVCIGCGSCVAITEKYWEMAEDGKADLKGCKKEGDKEILETVPEADRQDVKDSAECCPVNCIHYYEKGKKIL